MIAQAVLIFIIGNAPPQPDQVVHMDVPDMRTCQSMIDSTYHPGYRGITTSHCEPKAPAMPAVAPAAPPALGGVLRMFGR